MEGDGIMNDYRLIAAIYFMVSLVLINDTHAKIINVPADQLTIQAGIDSSEDGDTVLVAAGTYSGEGNKNITPKFKKILIASESGAENCLIDCEGDGVGFYVNSGEPLQTMIKGFSVTGASGSAIACQGSSVFVVGCRVSNNVIGIGATDGSPIFVGCEIRNSQLTVGGGRGFSFTSSAIVYNCTVENNDWRGFEVASPSAVIKNCRILDNTAADGGDGMWVLGNVRVKDCLFAGNGIMIGEWSHGVTVDNCLITGARNGILVSDQADVVVKQTTISDNQYFGVAINTLTGNNPVKYLFNSIVWNNGIDNVINDGLSPVNFSHCDISPLQPGEGNIAADPLFVAGPSGNYYLSQRAAGQDTDSPCVDAGSYVSYDSWPTTRTDEYADTSWADIGYRHRSSRASGITAIINPSARTFAAGDEFLLHALLHNAGSESCQAQPFVVVFETGGAYYWRPSWGVTVDWQPVDLAPGEYKAYEILKFTWPENVPAGSGTFYAAVLAGDLQSILGDFDFIGISWTE